MIKSILNLFGSLLVGMVAGILITVVGIALFTDMPLSEFIQKFLSVGFSEVIKIGRASCRERVFCWV